MIINQLINIFIIPLLVLLLHKLFPLEYVEITSKGKRLVFFDHDKRKIILKFLVPRKLTVTYKLRRNFFYIIC